MTAPLSRTITSRPVRFLLIPSRWRRSNTSPRQMLQETISARITTTQPPKLATGFGLRYRMAGQDVRSTRSKILDHNAVPFEYELLAVTPRPKNNKALRRPRRRACLEKQSRRQDLNLRPHNPEWSEFGGLRRDRACCKIEFALRDAPYKRMAHCSSCCSDQREVEGL